MTRTPVVVATLAFVGISSMSVVLAGPALADGSIDAKLQCQVEYGSQSEMGAACKEGVDLAAKADATAEDAMNRCSASRENAARVTACQQGVTLYGRFAGRVRSTDRSGFSYTWTQPKTGFQVDVGDYQASVGNQKAVDDCMRAFEGTDAPPSCMAGITVQPKAPAPMTAPARE
ncbi:MAG: hypothetical protein IT293_09895 [Deltaproteobacteria bacterium]|nr:hypothetical protein [Deltaproteobacteria bacterium]